MNAIVRGEITCAWPGDCCQVADTSLQIRSVADRVDDFGKRIFREEYVTLEFCADHADRMHQRNQLFEYPTEDTAQISEGALA